MTSDASTPSSALRRNDAGDGLARAGDRRRNIMPATTITTAARVHGSDRIADAYGGVRPVRVARWCGQCFFDIQARVADVGETALGILLQATTQQLADRRRRVSRQRRPVWLVRDNGPQRCSDVFAFERARAAEHLVEHTSK